MNKYELYAQAVYAFLDHRVSWEHCQRVKAEYLEVNKSE